ncbi:MAG: VPLPA-CTERM sorting domain-containing protein [Pseudomonadota bacterium]
MKTFIFSTTLAFGFASSVSAAVYTLDFDTTDPTNMTLDSSASQPIADPRLIIDDDVAWLLDAQGGAGAALFDTTCTGYGGSDGCNGDSDLNPASQNNADGVKGNVLIQQRSGGGRTPNDDARTNQITLTLDSDIELVWTGVSAIDNGNYRFSTSKDTGDIGMISLTGEAETGSTTFQSAVLTKGDQIFLFFDREGSSNPNSTDSGAIDNLNFSVVPLPASLPLFFAGMGALAWAGRRKRA